MTEGKVSAWVSSGYVAAWVLNGCFTCSGFKGGGGRGNGLVRLLLVWQRARFPLTSRMGKALDLWRDDG